MLTPRSRTILASSISWPVSVSYMKYWLWNGNSLIGFLFWECIRSSYLCSCNNNILFARNCYLGMITCYTPLYTVAHFNSRQMYTSDNYPRINYPIFSLSENYPLSADNKKSDKRTPLVVLRKKTRTLLDRSFIMEIDSSPRLSFHGRSLPLPSHRSQLFPFP